MGFTLISALSKIFRVSLTAYPGLTFNNIVTSRLTTQTKSLQQKLGAL